VIPFRYERSGERRASVALAAQTPGTKFLGGGTNLLDLMREGIETPAALVDVAGLHQDVEVGSDGRLMIGAGVTNTELATNRTVRERFPVLAQAILAGASGQIRNVATVGGNLLQRTRCHYFYDDAARCNKRDRGSGCDAIEGMNRGHAILGASPSCVATHPSDMGVALVALDAVVHIEGTDGPRTLPLVDLHRLPGDRPDIETTLRPEDLITAVEVPDAATARRSTYRKVRDRSSYAFALVSVAAAVDVADGQVRDVRLALGGVAPKPWRAHAAEDALRGMPATEDAFRAAAQAELETAEGLSGNAFKIELATRLISSTLLDLTEGAS
jgi:xanthine dehydrogenase YagS FAD-binding subunit